MQLWVTMPFAVPNFVKTCTEAELNNFLSCCVPAYKGWTAPWGISFRAGVGASKSGLGNDSRMDPGSWLWAGRAECSRMCLWDRAALMRPGTPAEQARVLSLSQNSNFWNLTNGKLFLRSEWGSKARGAPCWIVAAQPLFLEHLSSSVHPSTAGIQQGARCTLPGELLSDCWDCQQGARDVWNLKYKGNGRTTIKKPQQQSNLQNTNSKDIQISEGAFPMSERALSMFHDSQTGYSFKVLPEPKQSNALRVYCLYFMLLFLSNHKIIKKWCHAAY